MKIALQIWISLYFQSLTSGVDSLIQQKKTELEGLKQESYFQRKKAKTEEEESKEKGAKKKWINLDSAGFDDFDGTISGEEEEQLKAGKSLNQIWKVSTLLVSSLLVFWSKCRGLESQCNILVQDSMLRFIPTPSLLSS